MPYFLIQRDPQRFPFGTHTVVQADTSDTTETTFVLHRDDRVCWTAPAQDVVEVTEFETALAADERLKALRRWRSGRSTVKVTEGGATGQGHRRTGHGGRGDERPSGRGIAEGVSIRIQEN